MASSKTVNNTLSGRMDSLLNENLPEALNQLAQRHESFGQVVQYLEDNYIASQRSGKDKMLIEEEAKRFVTKGLVNVLKDIEAASVNLDQLVQLQSLSIDSLSSDVSLIKSRLHGMKSQHLTASLDEMKIPYTSSSSGAAGSSSAAKLSVREVEVDYVQRRKRSLGAEELSETASHADTAEENTAPSSGSPLPLPRRKISMEERLAQLDNIVVGSAARN